MAKKDVRIASGTIFVILDAHFLNMLLIILGTPIIFIVIQGKKYLIISRKEFLFNSF